MTHATEDNSLTIARLVEENERLAEDIARKENYIWELRQEVYSRDDKIRFLGYEVADLEDKLSHLKRELESARRDAEYEKNQAYQDGYQNGQNNAGRYY